MQSMNENARSASMRRTKRLVMLGIMVAMEIVLSRFLSISTPIVRIGFSFIPITVLAISYGPLYAGLAGAVGDFVGVMLFPTGPYFPGFTLSAFITGIILGLFLYKKPKKLWRVAAATVLIGVVATICMGTLWLHMLWGKGVWALLPSRLIQAGIMVPLQTAVIMLFCYRVSGWINK